MPINLFYYLTFFMFSFMISFFLLLELSPRNFKAKLNFLLLKPDSFSNPSVIVCIQSFILYSRYFVNQIKSCMPL